MVAIEFQPDVKNKMAATTQQTFRISEARGIRRPHPVSTHLFEKISRITTKFVFLLRKVHVVLGIDFRENPINKMPIRQNVTSDQ